MRPAKSGNQIRGQQFHETAQHNPLWLVARYLIPQRNTPGITAGIASHLADKRVQVAIRCVDKTGRLVIGAYGHYVGLNA